MFYFIYSFSISRDQEERDNVENTGVRPSKIKKFLPIEWGVVGCRKGCKYQKKER